MNKNNYFFLKRTAKYVPINRLTDLKWSFFTKKRALLQYTNKFLYVNITILIFEFLDNHNNNNNDNNNNNINNNNNNNNSNNKVYMYSAISIYSLALYNTMRLN